MFDIKWIRENSQDFDAGLARRGLEPLSSKLIALDDERRSHVAKLQETQSCRNAASKKIGKARVCGDEVMANRTIAETGKLKEIIRKGEERERELTTDLKEALSSIANLPFDDVPQGNDETDNLEIRVCGKRKGFSFKPKEHFEIAEGLTGKNCFPGQMDFERGAKLAGSRFVILSQSLARLERALGQFMLDFHTIRHGYMEISPPLLVRDEIVYGTGQLPKFSEDLFHTEDGRWLIPTAESPLTNIVGNETLNKSQLPVRFTALTPCFRSEAGAAGRDTRGMLRQHQFYKVELVSITDESSSADELERMLDCAEEILKQLGLHYRVIILCTGDLGFSARKTYDIEVWLPGQNAFREISSCSVCDDFQARRMNARYHRSGGKGLAYVHTLNGSGVAVGRALIAILENYQNEDGSVDIPEVLHSYMSGIKKIESV